jgi:hypothetical protein
MQLGRTGRPADGNGCAVPDRVCQRATGSVDANVGGRRDAQGRACSSWAARRRSLVAEAAEEVHPDLRASVRTGAACVYAPSEPVSRDLGR